MSNRNKRLGRQIGEFFDDFWVESLALLSGLIASVCAYLVSDNGNLPIEFKKRFGSWIFGTGLFAFVSFLGFSIWQIARRKRVTKLESKVEQLESENHLLVENVKDLIDGYLLRLAIEKLGFGKQAENTERITLYLFDPTGKFFPIGRYSSNPQFRRFGRTEYPADKGCIAETWEHDWFFDSDFPDPITSFDDYVNKQAEYRIAKSVVEKLKMKSRL